MLSAILITGRTQIGLFFGARILAEEGDDDSKGLAKGSCYQQEFLRFTLTLYG